MIVPSGTLLTAAIWSSVSLRENASSIAERCSVGSAVSAAPKPRASSEMVLRCELLERSRRDDLAGGGFGAQGARFGSDGQGVVAVAVGDDGVLVRRLVEDACWLRAVGADQPNLVDLIRFQRRQIAYLEHEEIVLREIGDLAAGIRGYVGGREGDRLRDWSSGDLLLQA